MADHYDVLTGRKYTAKDGTEKTAWTKVGTAFSCRDGVSFNVQLDAFPLDGRLYITPPKARDDRPARDVQTTKQSEESDDGLPF